MSTSNHQNLLDGAAVTAGPGLISKGLGMTVLGFALVLSAIGAAFTGDDWRHLQHAWLVGASFVTTIGLGALFFVILQHLTCAGWSVVIRRLAEKLTILIPIGFVLFLPILIPVLFGNADLYPWADGEAAAKDPITSKKLAYLNPEFFGARMLLYFVIWTVIAQVFARLSLKQDETGDHAISHQMRRLSAPAMLAFALTITFFAFDALMSLDPHWFSTIFGVYLFGGSVLATLSILILTAVGLGKGSLKDHISDHHLHDLGKLLFAFVFFWGYIAFSQYMLIWYANIPEETLWFIHRQEHGWEYVSMILIFGHLLVPFGGLIARGVKRNRSLIAFWALFMLAMHLVDLFWLVNPNLALSHGAAEKGAEHAAHGADAAAHAAHHFPFSAMDVATWLGLGCIGLGAYMLRLTKGNLVPVRDPHLDESLEFVNV